LSKGWLHPTPDQFFDELFEKVAKKKKEIKLVDLKKRYDNNGKTDSTKVDLMLSGANAKAFFFETPVKMQNALSNYNPLGPIHNSVYESFEIKRKYSEEVGYGDNEDAVVYRMPITGEHWSEKKN